MIADKITDPTNKDVQIAAIQTLSVLLNDPNILLDPEDKRKITLMIVDQFTNPQEDVQKEAITAASALIHKDILPDLKERREITSMIVNRITDPIKNVQKEAIAVAGALIIQKDLLPNPKDKRKIIFKIVNQMIDSNEKAQKEAIIAAGSFIKHSSALSDSEKSEIAYKIALLVLNDTQSIRTRNAASKTIINLWTGNLLLLAKINIIQLLAEELSNVSHLRGKIYILNILQKAIKSKLPLDFSVFDKITDMVSESSLVGTKAEEFIRENLKDVTFSDDVETNDRLKLMIHIKMGNFLLKEILHLKKIRIKIQPAKKACWLLKTNNRMPFKNPLKKNHTPPI